MIAYKRVYAHGSKLKSLVLAHRCPQMAIEYKPNKWTHPYRGTSLMAFRTIKNAKDFEGYGGEIWKCEVVEAKREMSLVRISYILSWLRARINKKRLPITEENDTPVGTVFCSKIKLLRRLTDTEIQAAC